MIVRLDLNREEKRLLLEIVDNEGFITRQVIDNLSFFSFRKKRELNEFIREIKEIYITVKISINDDGPLLFPDNLAYTLQAIIAASMEYLKQGAGVIDKNSIEAFKEIVDQTMLNPKFA